MSFWKIRRSIIPENVEQFRKNLTFEPPGHSVDLDYVDEETGKEINYL